MYRILIFIVCCSAPLLSAAQNTNNLGIFFQAVAKDNFASPAKDRNIYVQSSILQHTTNGNIVLQELHQTNTDELGVFSISIGQGTKTGGTAINLSTIPWNDGPFFLNLKISIKPIAPIEQWDYTLSLIDLGTTQFGTVPYALYSNTTGAIDSKLNVVDTAAMLFPYAKAINSLFSNVKNNNASILISNQALDTKINLSDSNFLFVTPSQLKYIKFDTTNLSNQISNRLKITDTINMLQGYAKLSELFNRNYNSLTNKPTLFSGSYSDLTNKPTLFTGSYNDLTSKPTLFNGDYNTLSNQPLLFNGNYNSLSNKPTLFSGTYADLTGKPILFTGSYNDLTSKPTLFDGNYSSLTNKPTLFSGSYADLTSTPILFDGNYNSLTNIPALNLTGDITNNGTLTTLAISGVTAGTYGNAISIPTITVDTKGRVTAASSTTITPNNFPNKTNAEKIAMPASTATGTVIWCSNCGARGQLQVYNGAEWTDLTGAAALTSGILFNTSTFTNILTNTATANSNITNDGGASITARGVVWSTSVNPTTALTTKTIDGTSTGTYTSSITSLSPSTIYYLRPYATNSNGTVYGNQISFTTMGALATLTTNSVTSISLNGAISGGDISSDGGSPVIYRGLCWSTSNSPTINDNKIVSGTGTGTYTIALSGLNAGTTYYVRAFATNAAGTAYGNSISFTSTALAVGGIYQGGRIVYIFQPTDAGYVAGETHGFIMSYNSLGTAAFGSASAVYSTSWNFGTGMANTMNIANNSQTPAGSASKLVYHVDLMGYTDWYIPSNGEWTKILTNYNYINLPIGYYNTSTSSYSASCVVQTIYGPGNYSSGSTSDVTSVYNLRAIRNF